MVYIYATEWEHNNFQTVSSSIAHCDQIDEYMTYVYYIYIYTYIA